MAAEDKKPVRVTLADIKLENKYITNKDTGELERFIMWKTPAGKEVVFKYTGRGCIYLEFSSGGRTPPEFDQQYSNINSACKALVHYCWRLLNPSEVNKQKYQAKKKEKQEEVFDE